jgi:hypothetical protein
MVSPPRQLVAARLPLSESVAMKNALALTLEQWERWTAAVPMPLFPGRTAAGAGRPWRLSSVLLGVLAGELATAIFFLSSDLVSPVLVRSLQLFLRF